MMYLLAWVVVYSGIRLLVYGTLSSAVMFASGQFFKEYLDATRHKGWIGVGRVSDFASWGGYTLLKKKWFGLLVKENLAPNLVGVGGVSLIVTFALYVVVAG
jgi:hypothetical protein